MATSLPAGFEALESYAARFAISGTANRAQFRSDTGADEREAFYAAAKDLIAPAIDYLDTRTLAQFDPEERRLMDLALTFAHIAIAIEVQGPDEAKHAKLREHMVVGHSSADRAD